MMSFGMLNRARPNGLFFNCFNKSEQVQWKFSDSRLYIRWTNSQLLSRIKLANSFAYRWVLISLALFCSQRILDASLIKFKSGLTGKSKPKGHRPQLVILVPPNIFGLIKIVFIVFLRRSQSLSSSYKLFVTVETFCFLVAG